jgi:hypothetical protein
MSDGRLMIVNSDVTVCYVVKQGGTRQREDAAGTGEKAEKKLQLFDVLDRSCSDCESASVNNVALATAPAVGRSTWAESCVTVSVSARCD